MKTSMRDGYTLLELMLTTLMLGILAATAIPSFLSYQARSRRTEAFANLQALARAQTSFRAESDVYFSTDNSYPDFTAQNNSVLSMLKMVWNAEAQSNFGDIGWAPEYRFESAVAQTWEWFQREDLHKTRDFDFQFEDDLLARIG